MMIFCKSSSGGNQVVNKYKEILMIITKGLSNFQMIGHSPCKAQSNLNLFPQIRQFIGAEEILVPNG
jgi:hypothetical protein